MPLPTSPGETLHTKQCCPFWAGSFQAAQWGGAGLGRRERLCSEAELSVDNMGQLSDLGKSFYFSQAQSSRLNLGASLYTDALRSPACILTKSRSGTLSVGLCTIGIL